MSTLLPVLVLTALVVTQPVLAAPKCEIGVPSCCDRARDCDDDNACNGTESCDADTGTCNAGSPVECDSPGDCLVAVCEPVTGVCIPTPAPLGTPCEDGNACTTDDTCIAVLCVGGPAPDCADTNPCTDDTCNPSTGCVHTANSDPCDDLNACTTDDTCKGRTCVGGPDTDCGDRNACTDDACDPAIGCVYTNNASSCDDDNACTTADTCAGGECFGGPAPDCSDPNPCTDDACAPATGCVHTNNQAACDDGSACTTGDMCAGGRCASGPAPDCNDGNPCTTDSCAPGTGCVHTHNTAPCSDGNACTTDDTCAAGVCVGGPPPDCSDPNPCTTDSCAPTTGCVHTNNAVACNDGNACTNGDTCVAGACVGGSGPNCNDGNPCTDDSCAPGSGCVHTDNRAPCEDGNACTTADRCSAGACVGGAAPNCSDENPCTDDTCAPSIGCVHSNNVASCDDRDACTTADRCVAGSCVGGAAPNCNDGDPCSDDSCAPARGCVHTDNTATCNDGNPCTTPDTCRSGTCTGGPAPSCEDGDPCTKDSCLAASGCQHVTVSGCHACNSPADCNDGSPCTTDLCVDRVCQWVNNTAACDDGNGCTRSDRCQAGTCVGTDLVVCPQPDQCHAPGTCNPASGTCSNPALPNGTSCDDGTACTRTDRCQAGACVGTDAVVCPAAGQCHAPGSCNPQTGACSDPTLSDGTFCNDGTACTRTDRCQAGACVGTNPVVCPLPDECRGPGMCNPETGICSNPALPNDTSCDDGTACTRTDRCQGGACVGTSPVVCPASDQCHAPGSCNPANGTCSNPALPNGTFCNDGTACTRTDRCQAGACIGTDPILCPTPDQCHRLGLCEPASGVCSRPERPDGTVCNDGMACTRRDTCQTGLCAGGNPVVCPAPDQCHAFGTCNAETGVCSNPALPDGSACYDGTACTRTDRCADGVCTGTDPVVCPAPDACHFPGSCDPATGICSTPSRPTATPCNDRDACTVGDRCIAGACSGVLRSCDDGASCSDDACVDGECQHQPVDARCETGECALNHCQPGARGADASGCAGEPVSEGEVCTDDGFACTTDVCTAGACRHTAAHERCATGEVCGPTVCDPVHTQADAAGCVALFDQVSGKECAEDGDPCTQDSCAAGACAHTQVPNKPTCDPVRPAFERAQALAAAAQGLSALLSAVLSPAAQVESKQALMGSATEVATSLERVTRILAGKTSDTQIAPRATRGAPAEGDTVAMARARIAFVEMQHTPRDVQAFLQDLAVARERALVARSSATDIRKRGRELRRGTKVLKRDLKRLQRAPRSFTR